MGPKIRAKKFKIVDSNNEDIIPVVRDEESACQVCGNGKEVYEVDEQIEICKSCVLGLAKILK